MSKLIIFDLDNTFYDYELSHNFALSKVFEFQNIYKNYDEFLTNYNKTKADIHHILEESPSKHSKLIYFKLLFYPVKSYEEIIELEQIYWDNFIEFTKIDSETIEIIKNSKNESDIFYLFTNQNLHIQLQKISSWGLDFFDYVLTSEEVGFEKPNIKFYKHVLKKLMRFNVEDYDFYAIGDSYENDVKFWFDNYNATGYLIDNKKDSLEVESNIYKTNFELAINNIFN